MSTMITKEVIEKAIQGAEICNKNVRNAHIVMRSNDERYIDYIVQKNNWYHCPQDDDDTFVYWENSTFGFTFSLKSLKALVISGQPNPQSR